MRLKGIKKTVVVFQITAIVLLQFYALAPLFSKTFIAQASSIRCTGDHKKCGCSPARIANHTCCCFKSGKLAGSQVPSEAHQSEAEHQSEAASSVHCGLVAEASNGPVAVKQQKSSCCGGMSIGKEQPPKNESEHAVPVLTAGSCFGDPDFMFSSLENAKFIQQHLLDNPPEFSSFVKYHQATMLHDRFLEPPVPPPQLSILS